MKIRTTSNTLKAVFKKVLLIALKIIPLNILDIQNTSIEMVEQKLH